MLIGEAPGFDEDRELKPFVGQAGGIYGRWLFENGIFRKEVYTDNVFQHRPPNNAIPPGTDLRPAYASLESRIRAVDPAVIVPMGETALNFFGRTGIGNWRGCCFAYGGRWVVPTLHPAFIMRQQALWRFCVGDIGYAWKHAAQRKDPQCDYRIGLTGSELSAALSALQANTVVTVDLETTDDFRAVTEVALSWAPHQAVKFDLEEEHVPILMRFFKRPDIKFVNHNIFLFDSIRLYELFGFWLPCYDDTMLTHHMLHSQKNIHDLEFVNSHTTRYPPWKADRTHPHYACKDADYTRQIHFLQMDEVRKEGMEELHSVRMRAAHYVRKMRLRGVPADKELVKEAKKELEEDLKEPLRKLQELSDDRWFNPRSSQQCAKLLYDQLKLPRQHNRKKNYTTGRFEMKETTDDDALVKLAKLHEVPKLILHYRRPANDLSKYFKPETIVNGRWWVDFKMHGTEVGRYSSWFHTLPPRVRYVVRLAGKKIAYADAQQGEFRIAASKYCADDKIAQQVIESPLGVHVANGVLIFRCDPADVTPMRKFYAKFTTYGWLYGRGAESIEEQYGVPRSRAEEIIAILNGTYKRIVIWKADTATTALRQGWLKNAFQSKRWFVEGSDDEKEREAYAFLPQSTLHDCVQRAHILVEENFSPDACEVVADMHDALLMVVSPTDFNADSLLSLISREYLPGLVMPFDCSINDWWYDKRAEEDKLTKEALKL